jgi:hypothetical protein
MMGVRGTGRPSSQHVVIRTVFAIRCHGDLHGLDRSRRPARSCASRCRLCARPTLRRDCRGGRIAELEFAARDPDAVHDHRELASHGDSGALDTTPFGDGDTPSPKACPFARTRHQRGRRFVEEVTQHSITALADVSRAVDFARLIDARGQPEMRTQRSRRAEPADLVDRGLEGEAGHWPYARGSSQAASDVIPTRQPGEGSIERSSFRAHALPHP